MASAVAASEVVVDKIDWKDLLDGKEHVEDSFVVGGKDELNDSGWEDKNVAVAVDRKDLGVILGERNLASYSFNFFFV